MRSHSHTIARTQRGHRLRLGLSAGHEGQLAALREQGQDEHRFHQREAPADAWARSAPEREVRAVWAPGRTFGGEPVGVEAFRVLPYGRMLCQLTG